VSTNEGTTFLSVGNEAKDKACLELTKLSATVDGVAQTRVFAGGRTDGTTKGSIGAAPGKDWCTSARFTIARTMDLDHSTNMLEVTDGTTTLHAEIPNMTTSPVWKTPPPAEVRAGTTFHIAIFPPPVKGIGSYDAENLAVVSIHPTKAGADIKLAARSTAEGSFDIDVPPTVAGGPYTLYFASSESVVPPVSCTAAACRSASEFVLRAPVVVAQ
ncbi:MAG: hypothetical protein ABI551_04425, partial [Polyangiaceae bacterium]